MELGFFGFLSLVFDRQPQAVMTTNFCWARKLVWYQTLASAMTQN